MAKKHLDSDDDLYTVVYNKQLFSALIIPSKTASLVTTQIDKLNNYLQLQSLSEQLHSLALFTRLASCGVKGHIDLEIKVCKILRGVASLCDETVQTLNDFKRICDDSFKTLYTAYGCMKDGLEDQAIFLSQRLKASSGQMAEKSSFLSIKCKEQVEEIKQVGVDTMRAKEKVEKNIKQQDDLIKKSETDSTLSKEQAENATKQADNDQQKVKEAELKQQEAYKQKLKVHEKKDAKLTEINQRLEERKLQLQNDFSSKQKKLKDTFEQTMEAAQKDYMQAIEESQLVFDSAIKCSEDDYIIAVKQNKEELDRNIQSN